MALLSIYRGTQAEVSERPVSDGALLFATDTKKIYLDKGSSRVEMSSLQDLSDYITSTQLSSAIGAEASARQKQDQLLEQAIDDKLGADDIVAGSNVQVSHDDESGHVTISATDTKYTAGTGLGMIGNGFYLLNGGVGLNQLANDSVSEDKLVDGAVDTAKIANGAVTADKLAAGVIPEDTNTTYTLTKSGSTITLEGSDGSISEVTDANTTYTLSSFGVTATATELNYMDGVTSNVQTQLNGKAASSHSHSNATTSAAGFLPKLGGGTTNFLRADGTWAKPPDTNTTYSNMTGATSSAAGKAGLVPAPAAGAATRYLRSDGTWQVPPDTNTTYTLSSFGITATATELNYMDGVTSNVQTQLNGKAASNHSHSTATTSAAGFLRQLNGSTSNFLRGDGNWATPATTVADGSITTAKLATDAVTSAKIATNAVTADSIAAGAVGTSELASNAVTLAKLGSDVGTVAVQSSTPSDTNVKLWIQV